jgi:hypothetical protein
MDSVQESPCLSVASKKEGRRDGHAERHVVVGLKHGTKWFVAPVRKVVLSVVALYKNIKIGRDWIAKITTPEGLEKPYRTVRGKYLIRVGSTKRISSREAYFKKY